MTGLIPPFLGPRLDDLEYRHAVFLLDTMVNNGWSIDQLAEGFADVFTDETGVATKTNMTFSAGQYGNAGDVLIGAGEGAATLFEQDGAYPSANAPADVFDGDAATYVAASDTAGGHGGWAAVAAGKQWASAKTLTKARARGETSLGLCNALTITNINVKLQGSNDGVAWTDLATLHNSASDPGVGWVEVAGSYGPYLYHRIRNYSTWSGSGALSLIGDVEFYEAGGLAGLLESVSVAAAAQPDSGRVVALVDQPGALGVDTVISMSRDGGATFTPMNLQSRGLYTGTTEVLIGTCDLSAQPAGTNMRVRAELGAGAARVVRGWYPQWG